MSAIKDSLELDIREQIVDAASLRFRHYGYNKTTMAEIAADTKMSAANLYRYFKNKQDIIAECASRCMRDRIERLGITIKQPGMSAAEQLRAYVLTDLQISHEMAEDDKKINELVNTITLERPDLVYKKVESEIGLIAEILVHGNESGEFNIEDITKTAQAIHMSLVIFNVPIFMTLFTLDQFREKSISIVDLLINGLARPNK